MNNTALSIPRQRIGKVIKVNGKPIGVAVAESIGENLFSVGFSALHANDKFNRELGIKIAVGRAQNGSNAKVHPKNLQFQAQLEQFRNRAARYFPSKALLEGRRDFSILKPEDLK